MSVFNSQQETRLPKPKYEYVTTEDKAREVLSLLDRYPVHAIDTEATALDPYVAKWSLLQIGVPDRAFVFDVRHDTQFSNIHPELFDKILQDPSKLRIMQNAAYDMKLIKLSRNYYVKNVYDTMLAEQLINLGLSFKKANLEALVYKYVGVNMTKEPRNTFADYEQKFEEYQLDYAINDVIPLHLIKDLQATALRQEELEHAAELEFDFLIPLCEMELNGISIDSDKWNIIMGDVDKDRLEIKAIIHEMLSSVESQTTLFNVPMLNVDSNSQLKEALNKYGIELENTSQPTLSKFAGIPIIDAILDYRKAEKLMSTYAQSLLDKINPITGRLHTDFRQMVSTGRLSSSNPNLQNIPKKQKYRSCFVAAEGNSLITCDMSSAELRILGNLSRDPVFLECFKNNIDLHTRSASEIFKVPMHAVDESMRDACKALSFGLMYGLSKFGLARRLKISESDAQSLINNYFNVFKGVKKYLDKSATDAVMKGYSLSISGRRRYYSRPANDHPDRDKIINSIKRQAMNAPIQSANADTIKKSMVYLVERLKNYDAKLLLSVHDEIIIESANECVQEVGKIVSQSVVDGFNSYFSLITMESTPLIGPSWLKSACKAKKNNVKCGSTEMTFIPDTKYGTKLVCAKCGSAQE